MSDESFGGNVSGVAMEFKLLGMENITKIKTRYYKKGLRKRLRILLIFTQIRESILMWLVLFLHLPGITEESVRDQSDCI